MIVNMMILMCVRSASDLAKYGKKTVMKGIYKERAAGAENFVYCTSG